MEHPFNYYYYHLFILKIIRTVVQLFTSVDKAIILVGGGCVTGNFCGLNLFRTGGGGILIMLTQASVFNVIKKGYFQEKLLNLVKYNMSSTREVELFLLTRGVGGGGGVWFCSL